MEENRKYIADLIFERLLEEKQNLTKFYKTQDKNLGYFYLDDLLPKDLTTKVYNYFPDLKQTKLRKNIREYKYVAYKMNTYNPFLEEVIYAFQDERIVKLISNICGLENVSPDEKLYAGGLSLMKKGNYLNPHLDNSHDKDRDKWRVLNLLYYVTPEWELKNGGNLELWPKGVKEDPLVIESRFNRLVVMATHQKAWHSVNKVMVDGIRCCVSNYYFSDVSYFENDSFHITSFRGRPEEKIKDFFLQSDTKLRSFIRKIFKKGVRENPHQYKK